MRRNFERPPAALLRAFAARLAQVKKKETAMDAHLRKAKTMRLRDEAQTRKRGGVRFLD